MPLDSGSRGGNCRISQPSTPANAAAGATPEALDSPVVVLTAEEAKGLEFDSVVIARPRLIAAAGERGAAALYVAMTRPTQRLTLVE